MYIKARNGNWHYRMIMAHELGHYLMHSDQKICFAYTVNKNYNIEHQANIFSTEFLISYDFAKNHSVKEISKRCGVPYKEAHKYKKYITLEYKHSKYANHRAKRKKKASNYKRKAGSYYQ